MTAPELRVDTFRAPEDAPKEPSAQQPRLPSSPSPAQALASYHHFPTNDQERWWEETGSLFSRFLEAGQYGLPQQYQFMFFFMHHLIPALGPYPQKWRSTISRSGLPIEFSLNFQKGSHRLLRIGFEPVSFLSGSSQDPFNRIPITDLLNRLSKLQLSNFDTPFFQHLLSKFQLSLSEVRQLQKQGSGPDAHPLKSQAAFGFDFNPDGAILVKGYVFPYLKAKAADVPVGTLIAEAVRTIDVERNQFTHAFGLINDYMQESTGYNEYTFLSCDFVETSEQRLKIYGAHTEVTWAKIAEMWTLGGRLIEEPEIIAGLARLKQIWSLLQIGEGSRAFKGGFDYDKSSATDQIASPIIWNYEIHPGSRFPVPKFYLPVHGENDLHVARALAQFWDSLGWPEHACAYPDTLQQLYPDQDISQTTRLQSWISYSYTAKRGVYMSVYYHSQSTYLWEED
uniref:Deoxybrevianamide E synthase notF n=2 Tax=Aspergillus sp. (strain MF297-2) TaxID=877550 RepID=NOTF_ASPSM|nr:RecName: Full=Deoxybrevianamide E synthase notF; AltName: Full=Reverse prenyltransferase notF [Aspergillus sp. MF297-2]ADM34132.1 reverse prenyltransferase [Aspergillus sp. MF297-2]ADM34139.1 aromatic prenyl-transferase [Aspergillus sp. MF297-2]